MTDDIFDSSLTYGKGERVFLTLPVVLGRPLKARGYNRTRIVVTDDGLLLKPYVSEQNGRPVKLPEWGQT